MGFKRKQAAEEKEQMARAAKQREEEKLAEGKRKAAEQFAKEVSAEADKLFLKPGDHVEIFGLTSEAGSKLNGKKAAVAKYEPTGRIMVELLRGLSTFHSVKPENL